MSVYKPKTSPCFHFDFQLNGRRFHGSTGCRNRRQAEAVERAEREKAKQLFKANRGAVAEITIDTAAGRYWTEVGQHHACAKETWANIERLVNYFGPDKRLAEINDDDVTKLVAWRRGHRRWGRKNMPLIAPATVNRSTTEVLQKLFTRARKKWNAQFEHEPEWAGHMLKEPQERVRELRTAEADALDDTTRDDFAPFLNFAKATGARLRECQGLRWAEVDWNERVIVKKGKGGLDVRIPITATVAEILFPLRGHHPVFVFTYVAQRTRGDKVRGRRYRLSYSGAKSWWRRLRSKAGLTDFRFHDFRHDVGTKLLRQTGNLKLVQKALNHQDIKTTTRYAHVVDDEVDAALSEYQESRKNSRGKPRKVS